jgi:hypothetical protein
MKVLGIFVLILSLSSSLSLAIDTLLLGFTFYQATTHLLNPFWVMDAGEYIMLLFFLLITIGQQIFFIIKNKANKQKGSS